MILYVHHYCRRHYNVSGFNRSGAGHVCGICATDFPCLSSLNDVDRYSAQMTELFTEVYNHLPLCHCINNKILVSAHSC